MKNRTDESRRGKGNQKEACKTVLPFVFDQETPQGDALLRASSPRFGQSFSGDTRPPRMSNLSEPKDPKETLCSSKREGKASGNELSHPESPGNELMLGIPNSPALCAVPRSSPSASS